MDFIKRHRLLLGILSFVLMGLPQAIDAIWSLAERIWEANIVMPEISIAWFSWITIPIGLVMLGIILWQVQRAKQPKQVANMKEAKTIPSRREALESAKVAWGLWHTGTRMRIEKLLEIPSLKRILLLEPNAKNPSVVSVGTKSGNSPSWIISEVTATTNEALDNGIDVRWYFTARESSLIICDPTPVGDKPCSENAWMYVEYFAPSIGVDQRKGHIIYNSGKDKNRFMGYYKEYEDIWNDSNKSTQAQLDEPEISIEIDNCSWGNPVIRDNQPVRTIEVALTLNVKNPPINVTDLQLYMGDEIQKFASPTVPFTQESNKGCYIAKYELFPATIYKVPIDKRNKYHLYVVAMGQKWPSREFSITIPNHLLAGGREDCQAG